MADQEGSGLLDGPSQRPLYKRTGFQIAACLCLVLVIGLAVGLPLGLKKDKQDQPVVVVDPPTRLWGVVSISLQNLRMKGMLFEQIVPQTNITYIELRQQFLFPPYETVVAEGAIPNATRIGELAAALLPVRTNYALTFEFFLKPAMLPTSDLFKSALETAVAIAKAQGQPVFLRLFDQKTTTDFDPALTDDVVNAIVNMTGQVLDADKQGTFVIENIKMPFADFREVVSKANTAVIAKFGLGRFKFCFDPANLFILAGEGGNLRTEVNKLPVNFPPLVMVHVKQSLGKGNTTEVFTTTQGVIDWELLTIQLVKEQHYLGPSLFEVEPSDEVIRLLDESSIIFNNLGWNIFPKK